MRVEKAGVTGVCAVERIGYVSKKGDETDREVDLIGLLASVRRLGKVLQGTIMLSIIFDLMAVGSSAARHVR